MCPDLKWGKNSRQRAQQVQRLRGGKGLGEFQNREKQRGWSRVHEAERGVEESGDSGRAPEYEAGFMPHL